MDNTNPSSITMVYNN